MNKLAITISAVMILGTVVFGASAFTSAELDRQADIDVVADDQGLISLIPSDDTQAAQLDDNGELSIDAAPDGQGLNVEGQFTYGDSVNPSNTNLFTIENGAGESFTLSAAYVLDAQEGDQGVEDTITFEVYDVDGNEVATIGAGDSELINVGEGDEFYVVMDINTEGLDSDADLSGSLQFSA